MSEELDPFAKRGGGPPTASFDEPGDNVEGKILKVEYRQDVDLQTNEPKRFPDGSIKPVVVVFLKTGDGEMRDFVKGRSVSEFRAKVWAAEGEGAGPKPGANYKRTFVRTEEPKKKGFSGEKVFEIEYSTPDMRELI